MNTLSMSASPIERTSWRCVPSPQSNSSRSPPRLTSTAGSPRRALGTDPPVPTKNSERSMAATVAARGVSTQRPSPRVGPPDHFDLRQGGHEGVEQLGVEGGGAFGLHLLDGQASWECGAVDAIGGQGVEHVCHRGDPSLQWDLL